MAQTKTVATAKKQEFNYSLIVIIVALIISELLFYFVFGNKKHFKENGDPVEGDYMGLIHQGGFIVPLLMTMTITLIVFSIERFMTITKAKGKGSLESFLQKVKYNLASNNIDSALQECARQRGSVANVVNAGLIKYKEMEMDNELTTEQKVLNIQKEMEEATSLELPVLEKHLPILATIASVGTLVALLGTVLGMIRAFAGMAVSGSPDPAVLSQGISEALINTAIGIGTSAVAIIIYNVFTGMIDKLTYGIDEIGFSISQTFAASRHDQPYPTTNK